MPKLDHGLLLASGPRSQSFDALHVLHLDGDGDALRHGPLARGGGFDESQKSEGVELAGEGLGYDDRMGGGLACPISALLLLCL